MRQSTGFQTFIWKERVGAITTKVCRGLQRNGCSLESTSFQPRKFPAQVSSRVKRFTGYQRIHFPPQPQPRNKLPEKSEIHPCPVPDLNPASDPSGRSERHAITNHPTVWDLYKASNPQQNSNTQATMAQLKDIPLQNLYSLLAPITVSQKSPRSTFSNWARTFRCFPITVFEPESEFQCELILELARREGKTVRAAGVGHSPSDLPCTTEFMLRTEKLNRVLEVNAEKKYVTAQAGITLNDLHSALNQYNLAMINIGSISDQTLGGCITTATHGSGIGYGVMSTQVMALTLLLADGTSVTCSRVEHPDLFMASICGLGTTGLIISIQLMVEPAFRLKEVQESLPFDDFIERFDDLVHSAQHVRFWWYPPSDTVRCSYSDRTSEPRDPAGSWFWGTLIGYHLTQLLLFIGRFHLNFNILISHFLTWAISQRTVGVDESHVIFNVDCRYRQYTIEWAIPHQYSKACLQELRTWLNLEYSDPNGIRPHVPIEIRFTSPDDIWLSPSNGQETCWIGLIQFKPYGFVVPYRKYFGGFESIVAQYQGRPHWAKTHPLQPDDLRKLYPRFDDFVNVIKKVDPSGLFRNEYIRRHIFGNPINGRVFTSSNRISE